jgi:hypothetical protein
MFSGTAQVSHQVCQFFVSTVECLEVMPSWCRQVSEETVRFPVWKTTGKDSSETCAIACQNCAVYSVLQSGMRSHSIIVQFNWEGIGRFKKPYLPTYTCTLVEEPQEWSHNVGRNVAAEKMYNKIFDSLSFDTTECSHRQRRTSKEQRMHNKVFGSRRFDTTECSHLQGRTPKNRECIRRHLIPDVSTQRNVLIYKVELPKNRGCITRYFVPDV